MAGVDSWGGMVGGRGRLLRSVNQAGVIGASLSTVGLFQIVRRYGGEIGRSGLAPHNLRRTYA